MRTILLKFYLNCVLFTYLLFMYIFIHYFSFGNNKNLFTDLDRQEEAEVVPEVSLGTDVVDPILVIAIRMHIEPMNEHSIQHFFFST